MFFLTFCLSKMKINIIYICMTPAVLFGWHLAGRKVPINCMSNNELPSIKAFNCDSK